MTKFDIPRFADEAEEAAWWYDNREMLSDPVARSFAKRQPSAGGAAGRIERLRLARELAAAGEVQVDENASPAEITGYIQYAMMSPEDRQLACNLAEHSGMSLPAFLSTLLHDELTKRASTLPKRDLSHAA